MNAISAQPDASLKILVFSASQRKSSLNTQLAKFAAELLKQHQCIVEFADIGDFEVPGYNQDRELDSESLRGAEEFRKRLLANDGMVIASPEYNGSMPGIFKNLIDWVSRFRPQPFNERHALLISASPSMVGGNRGLWALRMPLEHLGTNVYPNMFSLAMAHQALTPEGKIADEKLARRFEENLLGWIRLVEASKHYPCMKKAWFEFLGEKTDALTDRVE
ncbi:MAG: NAD(P)H-dependent oxidoreductase [Saprospiraceae bacterium]|nr:NAD(P)H-dependent oxidoreductase [Saprospiraceae bacterium]